MSGSRYWGNKHQSLIPGSSCSKASRPCGGVVGETESEGTILETERWELSGYRSSVSYGSILALGWMAYDIAFQSAKSQFTTAVNIVQIHQILVIGQPNCTEPRHNCTRVYHRSKLDFSTFTLS